MTSISYAFRVGHNTVSKIVFETCDAIWDALKDSVFLKPTEDNWRRIANEFEEKWNFPNCLGAIDGKHIVLQVNLFILIIFYLKNFFVKNCLLILLYMYMYIYRHLRIVAPCIIIIKAVIV